MGIQLCRLLEEVFLSRGTIFISRLYLRLTFTTRFKMIKRRYIKKRIVNVLVICLVLMTLNFFLKQRCLKTASNPSKENFAENISSAYNKSNEDRNRKSNDVLQENLPNLKTLAINPGKSLSSSKCGYNVCSKTSIIQILYIIISFDLISIMIF